MFLNIYPPEMAISGNLLQRDPPCYFYICFRSSPIRGVATKIMFLNMYPPEMAISGILLHLYQYSLLTFFMM